MFGKKKKQLEAERREEELRLQQEELARQQAAQQAQQVPDDKVFCECELIDDEDDNALPKEYEAIAYILKQEQGDDLVAQPVDDEPAQFEQVSDEGVEDAQEPQEARQEPVAEEVAQETDDAQTAAPVEQEDGTEDVAEEVVEDGDEAEESEELVEAEEESDTQQVADADAPQEEEVVYVVDGPTEEDDEIVKPAKLVKLPNLVDYMLSQNMSKKMKMNIAMLLLSAYNKYKDIPEEKKIVIQCMQKVMASLIQG